MNGQKERLLLTKRKLTFAQKRTYFYSKESLLFLSLLSPVFMRVARGCFFKKLRLFRQKYRASVFAQSSNKISTQ